MKTTMKSNSIVNNQCLPLPKEVINKLEIKNGDRIFFDITDNGVIITKGKTKKEQQLDAATAIIKAMPKENIEFFTSRLTTVCVCVEKGEVLSGAAICSPSDNFNSTIGKAIAYSRAMTGTAPSILFGE